MENLNLKEYKKGIKGKAKTINLRPKNAKKAEKINLSKLVNDFLDQSEKSDLKLEFTGRLENNIDRKVSTIYINENNLSKLKSVNLSLLVNSLLDSL